ncbi:MAG: AAA family ATPase [Candidatus Gracilibacteria bacterium]|nr:AAA family ATPase [Candidatus Gracilibacteria bacterium]
MLLNLKIKNFRSIKDEVVLDLQATNDKTMKSSSVIENNDVSLLKSVAIYGANASGKSNIMKAFVAFRVMVLESLLRGNTTTALPSEVFKLSSETESQPSFFEISFLIDNEIYQYGFEIDKKRVLAEWLKQKKGNKTLFSRTGQEIESNKNYFKEGTATLKKQTSERVLFLSVLSSNNAPFSKKIVHLIQNINYISGTNRGNTMDFSFGKFLEDEKMAEQMKHFIVEADFGIVDIQASQKMILAKEIQNMPDKFKELFFKEDSKIAERSLKFLHKKFDKDQKEVGNESLDFFAEESEGTQQMFALSAPIIDTLENGKILFIDEIDASLHPILCQYLITIFNSKEKNPNNAQLIFSTHDVSLLKEELLRRDQIYFTEKNKFGETELFSLSDISERKGVDFAKRYLEGRYNALPYISEFENLKFAR